MWKLIEISQQTYFVYCDVNISKEEVTFILYDLKETWTQTVAFKDVKLKVKRLNKRFDFSEDNIKEALTSGELKFAAIEEQPHANDIKQESLLLKLKYGIHSYVLNYEWNLRKQTLLEFQENFIQPLLIGLLGCYQQVEILTECIRKKDAELKQYRIEQAVLSRKTLATKPFDFDSFHQQYENSKKIAINFKELAAYVQKNKAQSEADSLSENKTIQPVKDEEKSNNIQKNSNSITTPTRRKRRKELELFCLERHLKARKEGGLKYESSQSQSANSDNSQTHDEIKAKVLEEKRPRKEDCKNKIIPDKLEKTPQKKKSSSPIKQKRDAETFYGTDSDGDVTLKSHKNPDKLEKTPQKKTRSSPIKQKGDAETFYDTDSDGDVTLKSHKTPVNSLKIQKKDANLRNLNGRKLSYSPKCSSKTATPIDNDIVVKNSPICSEPLSIFEFIDDNKGTTENKRTLRERQTKSPIVLASPTRSRILVHSPLPPVVDDFSSRLDNIKKELQCLEALRIADLKKQSKA